jgi:hypothetical protein
VIDIAIKKRAADYQVKPSDVVVRAVEKYLKLSEAEI